MNPFKTRKTVCALAAAGTLLLSGCAAPNTKTKTASPVIDDHYRTTYEIIVYSFYDSDGDGIGDLAGVTEKLDYIEDMGFDELWLMPIFPSPTYHKYDATDYEAIDPDYGTMEDFDALLSACHERDIDLILDLAVNHTSTEHPWFIEHPEYYNFSDEPLTGYAQTERGGKTVYYEARFWEGMPDLNLDSEAVREEIKDIAEFWLNKGVDGFRLDAVTSYYTDDRDKSISFLSWFNDTVKEINPDSYLVGEAWLEQSAYAKYYESGIDSLFDFEFAGQDGIIASVVKGNKKASYYAEALESEETLYASYNPDFVNAPFYTNHDMARSTGYYAYDDGSKTKLAGALNLLMTGNAFVYYGEELGMKGSGKDENKRAPMQWGEGAGLCIGPPDMDNVAMKFGSVAEQSQDEESILSYYKNAIALRKAYPVIARGRTTVVKEATGDNVCAFTRTITDDAYEPVLIVVNVSEEEQTVTLPDDSYSNLARTLSVSEEHSTFSLTAKTSLTLPPYGVAVLTK